MYIVRTHMNVTHHMRLDRLRHLPASPCSPVRRHASVSPEALGAQSLVNNDDSSDVHHYNNPRRDIDRGHSIVYNDDDRSIGPITTSNPYHSSCDESLLIPILQLQLALFTTWNYLLSLWR